jgi:glutamyl-tRNA reductase
VDDAAFVRRSSVTIERSEASMHLLLVGMNHRSASLDDRESLALEPEAAVRVLSSVLAETTVLESVVLSTCNRTEFYAAAADTVTARQALRAAVAEVKGADLLAPADSLYEREDSDAVQHLFRVASGLDSMVLGESEILSQVKDAYLLARGAGATGLWLDRLFESALRAGKRARTETAIGSGVTSVASAACELARRHMEQLAGRKVLVIGAGETSRLAATHLARQCPDSITVVNRTDERAQALADEIGASALPFNRLDEAIADVDLVVSATRASVALLTTRAVRTAMAGRTSRPLVVIDLAVPRDVEPDVAAVPGVILHTIDAIQSVVDLSLARRAGEVPLVETIVQEEAAKFDAWRRALDATPVLRDLRDHFERVRVEELERALHNVSGEERERAERLTRALCNRLLHLPTVRLKDADPASDEGASRLRAARELFALEARKAGHVH